MSRALGASEGRGKGLPGSCAGPLLGQLDFPGWVGFGWQIPSEATRGSRCGAGRGKEGAKHRAWETRHERGAALGDPSRRKGQELERECNLPPPPPLPGLGLERGPLLPPQVSVGWWPSPGTPSTSPRNSLTPCILGPSECGSPTQRAVGGTQPARASAAPHLSCPQVRAGPRPLPGLERLPARHPGGLLPRLRLLPRSRLGPGPQVRAVCASAGQEGCGGGCSSTDLGPSEPGSPTRPPQCGPLSSLTACALRPRTKGTAPLANTGRTPTCRTPVDSIPLPMPQRRKAP